MMRLLITSIIIFLLYIFNSYFLNNSSLAKKSDIIVSLGGDKRLERIKKANQLFIDGYSTKNIILLTGYNEEYKYKNLHKKLKRKIYLNQHNTNDENIYYGYNTKNTYSELRYIKYFMLENNYKTSIIVSDPPHSRRISILLNLLKFKENQLDITIVNSEPNWWENSFFKFNKIAFCFIILENLKIIHNYFKYGL